MNLTDYKKKTPNLQFSKITKFIYKNSVFLIWIRVHINTQSVNNIFFFLFDDFVKLGLIEQTATVSNNCQCLKQYILKLKIVKQLGIFNVFFLIFQ